MALTNSQTEWARTLIHGFVQAGVRDVVISPGSRSTPFVLAALERTELKCHSIIDERAASFFALGQAKYSGVPSLLLCTSGSALANYMPAVVEAYEADVPLIVLSADRPLEVQGCCENQTTDQTHFFGHHVRSFIQASAESESEACLLAARRLAVQAVAQACSRRRGPVHFNIAARKPLEPQSPINDAEFALQKRAMRLREQGATRFFAGQASASREALQVLHALCIETTEGMIALGPSDQSTLQELQTIVRLSRKLAWPIVADATHPIRWFPEALPHLVGAFDLIGEVDALTKKLAPRGVLQLGRPLVGNGWSNWLNYNPLLRRIVISNGAWADPTQNASVVIEAEPLAVVQELDLTLGGFQRLSTEWCARWRSLDLQVWAAVENALQGTADLWSEPAAVRAVFDHWPGNLPMVVGNSLPVRHINQWIAPRARRSQIFSRRGVSGIEGFCATAAGIASKAQEPTCLLVGDVAFLHDLTGIQALRTQPVVAVVINNGGGRIFEELPIQKKLPEQMNYFITPHHCDFEHAARLFGVSYVKAHKASDIQHTLQGAIRERAPIIVDAIVAEHSAAQMKQQLRAALETFASRA